jgi:hypothetical protein
MEKQVLIFRCVSKKPETKGFCFFEVTTSDKSFARKEIDNYCVNHNLSYEDYLIEQFTKR